MRDLLKKLGGKVSGELLVPLGDEVNRKTIRSLTRKKTRTDMIINTLPSASSALLYRELRNAGIKASKLPTLSVNISEHELETLKTLEMGGEFISRSYYESSESAKGRAFVASFKEKFGQHRRVTSAIEAAYTGVHLWAAAVAKAQNTSPKAVRQALRGLTFNGPAGEVAVQGDSLHLERLMEVKQVSTKGALNTVHSSSRRLLANPFPDSRPRVVWEEFIQDLYRGWNSHWEVQPSK